MDGDSFRTALLQGATGLNAAIAKRHSFSADKARQAADVATALSRRATASPKEDHSLETLRQEVEDTWKRHGSFGVLQKRLTRRAPWALFFPTGEPQRWLASESALWDAYVTRLRQVPSRSAVATLARVFLTLYPTLLPNFERWRAAVEVLVLATPKLEQLGASRLLKAGAPSALALEIAARSPEPSMAILEAAGLNAELQSSSFTQHLGTAALKLIGQRVLNPALTPTELHRNLSVLFSSDGSLRFPQHRSAAAEALLRPCLERQPAAELQQELQEFFKRHLGDPRMSDSRWIGVDPRLREVLTRWLVAKSFEDFFAIMTQTAMEEHWAFRRAFWEQYLVSGAVTDAWPVFGRAASKLAARAMPKGSYGVVTSDAQDPAQSVLLMRLRGRHGAVSIAEFTHNGSCRFWNEGNKAPPLYAAIYARSQLTTGPDFKKAHSGSATGAWQTQIRDWLREATGSVPSATSRRPAA